MKVTALMLSVDEAQMHARSLPAALAQAPVPDVGLIDNACTDETAQLAERHGARIALTPEARLCRGHQPRPRRDLG